MEAFQLLSRGGLRFDKNRFKSEVGLFEQNQKPKPTSKATQTNGNDLPAELDFFKYAEGGKGKENEKTKRKSSEKTDERERKRPKIADEDVEMDDMSSDDDVEEGTSSANAQNVPKHRISTKGLNPPSQALRFEELKERYSLPPQLFNNLAKNGYHTPTAIQSAGIPVLLESRDLAAISPTGTGKTLAYLLPLFARLGAPLHQTHDQSAGKGVRAVVVAPTRELAHQIYNECLKLAQGRKWRITLFSKATASTLATKEVRDKTDIIVSTPLRLVAAVQEGKFELENVRYLVLDEADRLLDTEFLEQTEELVASCTHSRLQKAIFSATLPAGVEKIAMDMLQDPIRLVVGLKDTPLPLISQSLTYVADDGSKLPSLLTYLAQPYNPPVLVFTSSQPRATSLAEELLLNNIKNVDCLHAGMTNKEREDVITRMRKGETWILITTEVMARGMDFKGVREVINYDFPTSVQSYVHRIGRTGRAGREGKAVTFFTNEDAPFLKIIANVILQSGSQVPEWILKLPKPSKIKRRLMGKIKRPEIVNNARRLGRREAIKKRDMIAASKRRKAKEASVPIASEP
ncbi:ROK1 [Coprinopsis cinerea okayama7|uniref:RNA helicase n=1 Tax=Coprinopsis cinerea (strain Okayama-7 / 130 / ATCC MYA-4618 / FGSC 9003) TaxID=240176 RepID=A8N267_COPC7|nr:ROK1 [Coprinopsis cinerea okayama7\|eukprot:XP_001828980.1 ROK1 [Coprinopsis cinerea okayama7\